MAERKSAKRGESSEVFSAGEKAAMRELVKERKSGSGEADVLAKIAEMPDEDRAKAEKFHDIVRKTAPELTPRTWYGMPAYSKDDKVVCHFKPAAKFKMRYAVIGFSDRANLDDGDMWPVEFAVSALNAAVENRIVQLVKKAAG